MRAKLPVVALTFDDGPDPVVTPAVVRLLRTHRARATFFMTGSHVAAHPQLVREAMRYGEIANHSWDHPNFGVAHPREAAWQIRATSAAIESATGRRPRWFRPPYGAFGPATFADARREGLAVVMWDSSVDRYRGHSDADAAERVVDTLRPGSIILAHDGCPPSASVEWCSRVRGRALRVLARVLATLRARGWRVGTVSDLLAASD